MIIKSKIQSFLLIFIFGGILLLLLPLSLSLFTPPAIDFSAIWPITKSTESYIFYQIRLPRSILAFFIGASLSLSGASFQALLKNPLADPYILGISGGAALGYVLAVVFGLPFIFYPIYGFVFALLSLIFIYRLAQTQGRLITTNLLLIGVIFNAFSFAMILLINALAHFHQSQQILYLLLGSIASLPWSHLIILMIILSLAMFLIFIRSQELNIMSLGDREAFHLGVNIEKEKKWLFLLTSLLVGTSVSVCGLIGFVGLFVPHLMRLIFGADHRLLMPACVFFGGAFLTISDYLAGHLFIWESLQTRLPVGVITALIGAPAFVWLLKRQLKHFMKA